MPLTVFLSTVYFYRFGKLFLSPPQCKKKQRVAGQTISYSNQPLKIHRKLLSFSMPGACFTTDYIFFYAIVAVLKKYMRKRENKRRRACNACPSPFEKIISQSVIYNRPKFRAIEPVLLPAAHHLAQCRAIHGFLP